MHIPVCFFTNYRCRQIAAFSGDESSVSTSAEMQIMSSWLNSAVRSILISPLFAHCEQSVVIKRVLLRNGYLLQKISPTSKARY